MKLRIGKQIVAMLFARTDHIMEKSSTTIKDDYHQIFAF